MNILVIGGTQFVGRHFAEAAIRAGHGVTLFHRGSKGIGSVPGAADILGDRTENLDRVCTQDWDLVMDSSGYTPSVVRSSLQALQGRCGRYLFVSTISVYDTSGPLPISEGSAQVPIGNPNETVVNAESYGYLKVLCEQEVVNAFGERSLIIRPGIIAGSHDPTNRFTYWVMRFANGGKVLVPSVGDSRLQLVDARDLAEYMVLGAERGLSGPFNVAGPASTFGDMISVCETLGTGIPAWVEPKLLKEADIHFGKDLPLATLPGEDKLFAASSDLAVANGLGYRPLLDTAKDVLQWKRSSTDETPHKVGLNREREVDFIQTLSGNSNDLPN